MIQSRKMGNFVDSGTCKYLQTCKHTRKTSKHRWSSCGTIVLRVCCVQDITAHRAVDTLRTTWRQGNAVERMQCCEINLINLQNSSVWRRQKSVDLRSKLAHTERDSLVTSGASLKMLSLSIDTEPIITVCTWTGLKFGDTYCNKGAAANVVTISHLGFIAQGASRIERNRYSTCSTCSELLISLWGDKHMGQRIARSAKLYMALSWWPLYVGCCGAGMSG